MPAYGVLLPVCRRQPDRLEIHGTPVPLLEDVAGNAVTGGGQLDFSQTGTLVYLAGTAPAQAWPVVWLDHDGNTQPLLAAPAAHYYPHLSPDGKRLALVEASDRSSDLFVYDWQRDTMVRLTFGVKVTMPIWTRDGKHIVFESVSDSG